MASNTKSALSLHVVITVAPENVDKFLAYLKPAYDAVCAEQENIYFEVLQDPERPGRFKFVENWNCSKEWLMTVQLAKDYYKPYLEGTEPLWIEPRTFEIWERMPNNQWISVKKEMTEKA